MAKKSWLFHLLKKLFICESKPLTEKKSKGWGWLFGRFKLKQLPTAAEADHHAVTSSLIFEARAEQREHAINVARATAAAAEAAVAAAQAAAEVVRLSGMPHHLQLRDKGIRSLAALRIQTAFRGFLARKALKALKGLVRLQAIARGRAVRRRTCHRLKQLASSPSTSNKMSEFHVIKLPVIGRSCANIDDKDQSLKLGDQGLKIETKSTRRWNESLFCWDKIESLSSAKLDATTRKERMQQHPFSNNERRFADILEEPFTDTGCNERQIYLLKHLADDKSLYKKDKIERISSFNLTPSTKYHHLDGNLRMRRQRSLQKQDTEDELLMNLPFSSSCPRRSFSHHRCAKHKPNCRNHDGSCTSSPGFPSYMATTESAKAKMRSLSTPRQRLGYRDTCFDDHFDDKEYNNNNSMSSSTWSCFNCEEMKGIGKGSHCFHQLKSLSMRSLQEPTMISQ